MLMFGLGPIGTMVAGKAVDFGLSKLFGSKGNSRQYEDQMNVQQLAFQETQRNNRLAQKNFENRFRIAAKDARKAGLHPMAVLGAAAGTGPAFSTFSPQAVGDNGAGPETSPFGLGSQIVDAYNTHQQNKQDKQQQREVTKQRRFERLLRAAEAEDRRQLTHAQIRAADAQANRDNAAAMESASRRARIGQTLQSTRGRGGGGPYGNIGAPGKDTPRVEDRNVNIRNRESIPFWVEGKGPNGKNERVINPELGMDEVGQAMYMYDRAVESTSDGMLWLHNKMKGIFN